MVSSTEHFQHIHHTRMLYHRVHDSIGIKYEITIPLNSVGRMWLTLEDAGESERLDRCWRMIWEIEIEW